MASQKVQILDGKTLAQKIQQELQQHISSVQTSKGRLPGLAVLMVGDNPASAVYVRNKEQACTKVGITSFSRHFPAEILQKELEEAIDSLNQDPLVDGILVQLPLPPHLDAASLLHRIHPDKDVDGLHPLNLGRLLRGEAGLRSCTPAGVMRLLQEYGIQISGQRVVVIGRSILVGKPLALMLLAENGTVTVAHSQTPDLSNLTREADILVAAAGKPQLVTAEMVKPGAVVIDVGINRVVRPGEKAYLVGDVDFQEVAEVASYLTPVPGGIGPLTVAMLLQNTVLSYSRQGERKTGQGELDIEKK